MKKRGLIALIATLVMLTCNVASTALFAQKVTIEKDKLVELTKLAEKSRLYEGENVNLIVENYKMKEKLVEANAELAKAKDDIQVLKSTRNKLTVAIVGFGLLVVLWIAAKVFKPKWL
jgi:hypothetical protein